MNETTTEHDEDDVLLEVVRQLRRGEHYLIRDQISVALITKVIAATPSAQDVIHALQYLSEIYLDSDLEDQAAGLNVPELIPVILKACKAFPGNTPLLTETLTTCIPLSRRALTYGADALRPIFDFIREILSTVEPSEESVIHGVLFNMSEMLAVRAMRPHALAAGLLPVVLQLARMLAPGLRERDQVVGRVIPWNNLFQVAITLWQGEHDDMAAVCAGVDELDRTLPADVHASVMDRLLQQLGAMRVPNEAGHHTVLMYLGELMRRHATEQEMLLHAACFACASTLRGAEGKDHIGLRNVELVVHAGLLTEVARALNEFSARPRVYLIGLGDIMKNPGGNIAVINTPNLCERLVALLVQHTNGFAHSESRQLVLYTFDDMAASLEADAKLKRAAAEREA